MLALLCAAQPAHSTDLVAMAAAASGSAIWHAPVHWCGLLAFALVVVAELGRQPVDNPDTHLELTMIHESALLEYGGRDLAYRQWAAAARHWVVMVLAAELFLPHAGPFGLELVELALRVGAVVRRACRGRDRAGEDADAARARIARTRRAGRLRGRCHLARGTRFMIAMIVLVFGLGRR